MKNIVRVTRPAWARLERSETVLILFVSLLVGVYGGWGERGATAALTGLGVQRESIRSIWPLIDVIIVTFGCLLVIHLYKRIRIGCYPMTFVYCFKIPEASNPRGKSIVVGYGQLAPHMRTGDISSTGASYFWEDGRLGMKAGYTSTFVHASREDDLAVCNILFDITENQEERLYRHGVLQFQLVGGRRGAEPDSYAGYLCSNKKDAELQSIEVRAKGYAQWHAKGLISEERIRTVLTETGDLLLARLETMLRLKPPPSLWRRESAPVYKTNTWGHRIPMPQSVVLDEKLQAPIMGYLSRVLSLWGVAQKSVTGFQSTVLQEAGREEDVLAYERKLKASLIGLTGPRQVDSALNERAGTIFAEIKEHLVGDSLLDIGCGNGLISSLARGMFGRIQLLDVVSYLPRALNLPFTLYAEGHPLPIAEGFDTVLLLTVLHHANDPVELLKLAWGATKKRLIIIESVVGVHQVAPPIRYEVSHLTEEDQIGYAAFIDWFYNRVLHDDVPVPYNFTTVERWQSIFIENGMGSARTIHLGQDIDIGPEYHVLFVLEKGVAGAQSKNDVSQARGTELVSPGSKPVLTPPSGGSA